VRSWGLLIAFVAACGGNGDNCATGQSSCDGTCVDTTNNHDNCGTCGHACGATEVCGNGTCGDACPANQMVCGGTCSDTTSDAMNCGGCGMACNAGDVCVDSECQVPCQPAMLLPTAVTDPWGIQWDGLERDPLALDAAKVACQALGARLPTATELYRVSASQTGVVGQAFNMNPLWSSVPDDKLDQATIKLSDGTATSTPATTPTHFRCVCPAAAPKSFTANHCNGTAGSACFSLGKWNIDTANRPALRKGAQVWECAYDRGHVADSALLIEGIRAGLPGTATTISTGDMANYYGAVGLKWASSTWTTTGNLSLEDIRSPSPFRCAGLAATASPNPTTIPNQFVGATSTYKGETIDNTPASWADAHDTCVVRGGHLPRTHELAELIQQGLPSGSDMPIWTSDEVGYNQTQFLSSQIHWAALDQRFSFYYGGADDTITWQYKTNATSAYRCVYYPIDATYAAPTNCTGGCFMTSGGGSPAITMWLDTTNRTMKNVSDATADCTASGGHLASERDLTEAIRAGLPNDATNTYILTSDFGFGGSPQPVSLLAEIVRWTNVDTSFDDEYPAYMTWSDPATARPYRCMWTNELR